MANATVEKLKVFGLRHGEKVVVALVAAVSVLLLVKAFSQETIDITPEQLKSAAQAASTNINRTLPEEQILAKLDEADLVNPGFAEKVEQSKATETVDASQYAFSRPWVANEPGAGWIRDAVELLAPQELHVNSGRGPIEVIAHTESGELIYPEEEESSSSSSRRGSRGRSGGSSSGYPGMASGGAREKSERERREEAEELARRQRERRQALAGSGGRRSSEPAKDEAQPAIDTQRKPKIETVGYRWVSLVGTFPHQEQRDLYVRALKDPNAQPNYQRLDLQRQVLLPDGSWSDWRDVDRETNQDVLAYVAFKDEELTPDEVRLEPLVDMLPWLKAGSYRGVHIASLVPEEKQTIKAPEAPARGGYPGMGDMSEMAMMSGSAGMDSSMMSSMSEMNEMAMMSGSSGYPGMASGSMPGMASGEDLNFPKTNAETIMLRSLDFTVDPDTTYRYRTRVVVRNPNFGLENVSPGVDVTSKDLPGPWSEETDPVTVPADVTIYAQSKALGDRTGQGVSFEVVRWNPEDGLTIVKNFNCPAR